MSQQQAVHWYNKYWDLHDEHALLKQLYDEQQAIVRQLRGELVNANNEQQAIVRQLRGELVNANNKIARLEQMSSVTFLSSM
jgi:hypothetical protein